MQIVTFLKFYTEYAESKSQARSPENSKAIVPHSSTLPDVSVDSSFGSMSGAVGQTTASST